MDVAGVRPNKEVRQRLGVRLGKAGGGKLAASNGERGEQREQWLVGLEREYQTVCDAVDDGVDTLLDPYGAESIGEFFAVASEAFFVAPTEFTAEHPDLYALLAGFYRQDPAAP